MAKLCEHGYFLEVALRSCPKCRTDRDLIQREEIESLRSTISRLREYAKHHPNCDSSAPECCCGLDRLLEESK